MIAQGCPTIVILFLRVLTLYVINIKYFQPDLTFIIDITLKIKRDTYNKIIIIHGLKYEYINFILDPHNLNFLRLFEVV